MGLLQQNRAVFYHPLDNKTEFLKSQDWTNSAAAFVTGKVSNALGITGGPLFGTESEFIADSAEWISVATLSTTKFVVAYRDFVDSNHGTARIGTISGTDVTFGAEAEFLSADGADQISVGAFPVADKFVVVYRDNANSGHGTAKIGTVSGTTITFGAEAEFNASASFFNSVAMLSATEFVVASKVAAPSRGIAKVGTVSGTDITFGAEVVFLAASGPVMMTATAIDASKFIVAYKDDTDSGRGTAKVGTVSGTDITFGAEAEFLSAAGAVDRISVSAIDATSKFVVAYTNGVRGVSKVGTVSGTAITFGAEAEFLSTGTIISLSAAVISSTEFVVAYRDGGDSDHGTVRVGTFAGTDITFGAETEFLSAGGAAFISADALDATSFVVAYRDDADSFHGTVKVGILSPDASLTGTGAAYNSAASAVKVSFLGWFKKPSV